ncbi:hypothetical protein ACW4YW_14335 [Methylobacillus pratensis]
MISGYNASLGRNQQQWKSGYADLRYDINGHLESAYDHGGNRSIQYTSDAQGLILVRDEITGIIARPNYQYNYNPGSVRCSPDDPLRQLQAAQVLIVQLPGCVSTIFRI